MKVTIKLLLVVLILVLTAGCNKSEFDDQNVNRSDFGDQNVYINDVILDYEGRITAAGYYLPELPFQSIFEQLGFTVESDSKQKTISATKGNTVINAKLLKPTYTVNGETFDMELFPSDSQGMVFVPVRVFQQALGAGVRWNEEIKGLQVYALSDDDPYTYEQLRRGLAAGAIYNMINGELPGLFSGGECSIKDTKEEKKLLYESWGIKNRKDALEVLTSLNYNGHNREFTEIADVVTFLNDDEFEAFLKKQNYEDPEKIRFVRKHYKETNGKGILAWDLVRQIAVAQWSFTCGYITYDEAVSFIMDAAIRLQNSFDSYKEMEDNHALGRWYWSLDRTLYDECKEEENWLLTSEESPWHQLDWNMSITPD
ncbi:MAG: DUF1266 domain-containing protein [Chitinophagales bacterium]